MAFPQIADADTKSGTVTTNSTSWTITFPTNIAAGDLLLLFIGVDGTTDTWTATGFTQFAAVGPTVCTVVLMGRVAAGTETGTFTANSNASEQGGWPIFRIPAASWFGGTLNVGGGTANDSNGLATQGEVGASRNPDPPLLNPANW